MEGLLDALQRMRGVTGGRWWQQWRQEHPPEEGTEGDVKVLGDGDSFRKAYGDPSVSLAMCPLSLCLYVFAFYLDGCFFVHRCSFVFLWLSECLCFSLVHWLAGFVGA